MQRCFHEHEIKRKDTRLFSSSINHLGGQTPSLFFAYTPGISVSQVEDLLCLPSYTGCYLFKSLLGFCTILLIGRGRNHFFCRLFTHNGITYTGFGRDSWFIRASCLACFNNIGILFRRTLYAWFAAVSHCTPASSTTVAVASGAILL